MSHERQQLPRRGLCPLTALLGTGRARRVLAPGDVFPRRSPSCFRNHGPASWLRGQERNVQSERNRTKIGWLCCGLGGLASSKTALGSEGAKGSLPPGLGLSLPRLSSPRAGSILTSRNELPVGTGNPAPSSSAAMLVIHEKGALLGGVWRASLIEGSRWPRQNHASTPLGSLPKPEVGHPARPGLAAPWDKAGTPEDPEEEGRADNRADALEHWAAKALLLGGCLSEESRGPGNCCQVGATRPCPWALCPAAPHC